MCKHNAELLREVVTLDDDRSPVLSGLVSEVVRKSLDEGLDEWQIYDPLQWAGEESEEGRKKREEAELQEAHDL